METIIELIWKLILRIKIRRNKKINNAEQPTTSPVPDTSRQRISITIFFATLFQNKNRVKISALACLAIPVLVGIPYGLYEYHLTQDPSVIYAKKMKTLTDQVSHYVTLPTNESPITATITDKQALPKEVFFKYAQDGDKVIMYKQNKLAILYRPSTNQVITTGQLDFANPTPTPILQTQAVAGASTSGYVQNSPGQNNIKQVSPAVTYIPQGKILIAPR